MSTVMAGDSEHRIVANCLPGSCGSLAALWRPGGHRQDKSGHLKPAIYWSPAESFLRDCIGQEENGGVVSRAKAAETSDVYTLPRWQRRRYVDEIGGRAERTGKKIFRRNILHRGGFGINPAGGPIMLWKKRHFWPLVRVWVRLANLAAGRGIFSPAWKNGGFALW